MSFSPAIELVWQMAAREAIVSEFKEIEPEHFLTALLKLAEMSAADLKPETGKTETSQNLAAENKALRAATSPSPPAEWIRALRTVYGGKTGRFVCAVAPSSYQQWILPDAGWKQASRAIWIHESVPDAIPETL